MYSPSTPSYRPSAPISPNIGVYRAKRTVSTHAIYAFAAVLFLFAVAFTVYLLLTGGQ
jgi:hypothetical protein